MTDQPWTWKQFMSAMRAADWQNMGDGHGVFMHKQTGRKFQSFRPDDEHGEKWKMWAKAHQTPPPF